MATLRPNPGTSSKSSPLSSSPSPRISPGSPSTSATSAAAAALPSNEEVEAVIKQATSTEPTRDGRPPPGKDTRTQLFTGNLPYRVRWQDLKDLFRRAGTVLRADVSLTPDNRSRGYGTVLLASAEDAGRAVDMFNGYNWQGRVLEVRLDRLGNIPGAEIEANASAIVPGVGISALSTIGAVNGLAPNLGSLNGLQVPSPHSAVSYVAQQLPDNGQNMNSSPALLSATSSLSGASQISTSSPLNAFSPNLVALQQQQLEKGREELLLNQGVLGRTVLGGLDPFSNSPGHGLGADLDREQSRSSLGARSLFVGNLPFHCQWQDLKDLFRQAGTILRADVSLGPDGRSRGFGTVTFANEIDAERAVIMFNGFDYNGRTLKVHYDKFCTQSPLPPTFTATPSNLATPVQAVASSAQAALLQAAQLQQLVSGQTYDRLNNLGNFSQNSNGSNSRSDVIANGSARIRSDRSSITQSVAEPFPTLSRSRPTTSSGIVIEQTRQRAISTTSEASPSPFSFHIPGTSPSLAERRQKVPPPIGPVSAGTSRRSSSADKRVGANPDLKNIGMTLSSSVNSGNLLDTSAPSSPSKDKRPTAGQSLPVSSISVPLAPSAECSSSTSEGKRPARTSASVPTLGSVVGSHSASNSTSTELSNQAFETSSGSSTSPRSSHPAHPGPISLPPPPPVGSFSMYSPHHHPMSPPTHPMSPPIYAGYPSYGPMSPMHAYPVPAYMHPANMTPHGLPPITPSMPSFSFAPQPSPGAHIPVGGSSAIPPTPADGTDGYHQHQHQHPGQPVDSNGNRMARGGMGMMPMMSPPLHLPHHVFQQFTPGTTMSPGAFYGRPNGGQPLGSYLNPAVGSPVLMHAHYGYAHPGSQPGSPYYLQNASGGQYREEPSGYFPPVGPPPPPPTQQPRHEDYFPPVSAAHGSSGLANEILRDGSTMSMEAHEHSPIDERPPHERNDSGSMPTSSENGPGEDTDAERARSSSSGATSWRSSDEQGSSSTDVINDDASKGFHSTLDNLVQDVSSMRVSSYAAAAATTESKRAIQRAESANGTGSGHGHHHPAPAAAGGTRHGSLGSAETSRPPALQKAHSDESSGHMRLNVNGSAGTS